MRHRAWYYNAAGWVLVVAASSPARSQPARNAAAGAVIQAGPADDGWVSAPGSFASSLSEPIRPLPGGFVFYGSGYPFAGPGFGAFAGFGYFALPRDGRDRMPLVAELNNRLPAARGQPGGAPAVLPRFLRRPARPAEPRGFGVLADEDDHDNGGVEDVGPRPAVRTSNASSLARARRFLQFGDERFGAQEFSFALDRYKKAAHAAPDFAEAHSRQAMAYVALGRYAQAAAAIKRGLSFEPGWPGSFRLDQLYGDNRLAKVQHLEELAEAASQEPDRADLMFLVGVELVCDGQPDRAQVFFQRAADLGEDAGLLQRFLERER
ncbi:MAG TPA: tetratricopeptide repeat protein [Pirellulales bacterium]|nr:tetratricopeptide repeat protein [Pirellulales bacterium]